MPYLVHALCVDIMLHLKNIYFAGIACNCDAGAMKLSDRGRGVCVHVRCISGGYNYVLGVSIRGVHVQEGYVLEPV